MALQFREVKPTARRAKVLLLGEAGSGKTHAALTFPSPAVIDAEGSVDWFADRFKFVAVPTKSFRDVREIIADARENGLPGETLVIDSLTSIYNGLVNAASVNRDDLRPLDWGRIKRKNSSLMDELYHKLPMHVVCIGWIKTEYAKEGDVVNGKTVGANDMVKLGETYDGERKTSYAFDFIVRMEASTDKKGVTRYFGTILKSRSGKLKAGDRIENFGWETIKPLLTLGDAAWEGMSDEEQIARDNGEDRKPLTATALKEMFDGLRLPVDFKTWVIESIPSCADQATKPRPFTTAEKFAIEDKIAAEKARLTPSQVGAVSEPSPTSQTPPEAKERPIPTSPAGPATVLQQQSIIELAKRLDFEASYLSQMISDITVIWDEADLEAMAPLVPGKRSVYELSVDEAARVLVALKQEMDAREAGIYEQEMRGSPLELIGAVPQV